MCINAATFEPWCILLTLASEFGIFLTLQHFENLSCHYKIIISLKSAFCLLMKCTH